MTFLIGKIPFIGLINPHIHLIYVHGNYSFFVVVGAGVGSGNELHS